jgi:hypothetical protein
MERLILFILNFPTTFTLIFVTSIPSLLVSL